MFVEPQINNPIERPISLITGTHIMLPVAQSKPPSIATGWNCGKPCAQPNGGERPAETTNEDKRDERRRPRSDQKERENKGGEPEDT
jgi:hypothetical protein